MSRKFDRNSDTMHLVKYIGKKNVDSKHYSMKYLNN